MIKSVAKYRIFIFVFFESPFYKLNYHIVFILEFSLLGSWRKEHFILFFKKTSQISSMIKINLKVWCIFSFLIRSLGISKKIYAYLKSKLAIKKFPLLNYAETEYFFAILKIIISWSWIQKFNTSFIMNVKLQFYNCIKHLSLRKVIE